MDMMSFPLSEVVQNWDAIRRTTKWALKLMGQGISYAPRTAIKSQVLADFIIEWTEIQMPPAAIDQECWTMYFDGLLMKKGAGMELVFVSPLRVCMRYMVRIYFPASTNVGMWPSLRHSSMAYALPSSWASDDLMSRVTPNWSSTRS